MRTALLASVLIASTAALALAYALPEGWSQRDDGAFVHQASTAICPTELGGLKRTQLASNGPPDLGVCTYTGDADRIGLIRVRQYVRGAGETPLAVQNDQVLIEPKPGQPDVVAGYRAGPGPETNGKPTRQFVLTFTRANKLLIDCIGRQLASDTTDTSPDFARACMKLQGAAE